MAYSDSPERCQNHYRWRGSALLWFSSVAAVLALMALNLVFADVNQDEGWYLYAARLVAKGKLPFLDFASTQGPVLPFVYVIGEPLVKWQGLAGGRIFTSILGLIAFAETAFLSALLVKDPKNRLFAAFLALVFCGVNVYQTAFFVTVKTYALCSVFLTGSFIFLTIGLTSGGNAILIAISGLLAALSAGTRLSALAVVPAVVFTLICFRKNLAFASRSILFYAIGSLTGLLLIFCPYIIFAPDSLRYGLLEYHAGRKISSLVSQLVYKGGFLSRMTFAYFVPISFLIGGIAASFAVSDGNQSRDLCQSKKAALFCVWFSFLLVTCIHLMAPFPYDDYQTFVFPLFAAVTSVFLSDFLSNVISVSDTRKKMNVFAVFVLVISLLAAFSSPRNQEWFAGKRDRIWWPVRTKPPIALLRDVGRYIKNLPESGDVLLTQDVYLAVECNMSVPEGLEMGPFSYTPSFSNEKAGRLKVLNKEKLLDLIEKTGANYAAFSGYGLAIESPSITPVPKEDIMLFEQAIEKRFELLPDGVFHDFGQSGTTLRIFRRKTVNKEAGK